MCWRDKENPLKMSEWQLGISYTTGANHLIMRCSFIPVEICLEQLHISFNECPAQKIMKKFQGAHTFQLVWTKTLGMLLSTTTEKHISNTGLITI
jgi:hypothetical protein